jgi:outer membrane protein TolC
MLYQMADDLRREIDIILDQHDEAFRAFRQASDAFEGAVAALRDTLNAVQAANHAQGDAIDALRTANQAALRLLRQNNGRQSN